MLTTYTYDTTNQLSSFAYPNGVTHAYVYDQRDRPTNLAVNGPGGVLANYAQTFSDSSHKQSVSEATGRTENYIYDQIYRLTNQSIAGDPGSVNGSLAYSLDPVGNRFSLLSTLIALPSQTATYDNNDRISADTFDNNGNTLTSGGHAFAYDFEDRLTQYNGNSVQIVYDGDGNRVSKTAAGVTTQYLVDTLTPTGYAQVAEEIVGNSVNAQYLYGLMRISQSRSGTVSYYGYDGHGSVRQLLSGSGAVTDTYQYDAFGGLINRTGGTVNAYMFGGEQYDLDLNLYYLRARWYNQRTGRFVTADKYEGVVNDPSTLHRYGYTGGDPVNRIDPSGRTFVNPTFLAVVAAITAVAIVTVEIHENWECIKEFLESLTNEGPGLSSPPNPNTCREQAHDPDEEE